MKTARDLILKLYKEDHTTKGETDLLLDAIKVSNPVCAPYFDWTVRPYGDWTYKPYEQPSWTITNNTDNTSTNNVE